MLKESMIINLLSPHQFFSAVHHTLIKVYNVLDILLFSSKIIMIFIYLLTARKEEVIR